MTTIRMRMSVVFASLVVGVSAGCPENSRNSVAGAVNYRGQPVVEGMIYFDPLDPNGRQTAGQIAGGKFDIPVAEGLVAGRYNVRITAIDQEAKAKAPPLKLDATGEVVGGGFVPKELLPEQYNVKTKLSAEIPTGGKNDLVFNLD